MRKGPFAVGPELDGPIRMLCDPGADIFDRLARKRFGSDPDKVDDFRNVVHRRLHLEEWNIFLVDRFEKLEVFKIFGRLNIFPGGKPMPHERFEVVLVCLLFFFGAS
jgi:hypothetical protein